VQVRQVAVALVDVEPVADEELVGDGEADVPHRQVLDEAAVRAVEERDGRERARAAQPEGADEVVERQPGVDDVLDNEDVPALDARVEVLEEPDRRAASGLAGAVAGQLDEIDVMQDRERAREVGKEDQARLQGGDEQRLAAGVVDGDLGTELLDPGRDLLAGEVDLADPIVREGRPVFGQEAIFSPYRWPRRSMSRL
jgi:hypothetical protein